MTDATPIESANELSQGLSARFWSLARGMETASRNGNPAACVRHVLAVLSALDRGETGRDLSVHTLSFLALLREGEQRGEVSYASPEQLRGETMDERSLVFSAGVLLFERLTGRHPFGAENNKARRLARIQKGEMGSGVNYFPNIPARLRTVLMRAMGPFPEERYRSLGELCRELHQFLDDQSDAGPQLPGTYARASTRAQTRVACASSVPSRDHQAGAQLSETERRARIAARRRDRLSQMHLRTIGRHRLDTSPVRESAPDSVLEAEGSREDHRPAMAVLPTRPQTVRQRPARANTLDELATVSSQEDTPSTEHTGGNERISGAMAIVGEVRDQSENKRASSLWTRMVYLGIGAAAAAALMMFMADKDRDQPQAPAERAPVAAVATPAPVLAPAPVATPVFAPESVTDSAAARLVECFADKRLDAGVRFRAGLRFAASDKGVNKVYFSTAAELESTEQSCVRKRLSGLIAGAAPEVSTVVNYQFRISGAAATATVK